MNTVQEWKQEKYANTSDSDHRQAIDALVSLLENETSVAATAKLITEAYEGWLLTSPESRRGRADGDDKILTFWVLYMCEAIRNFGDADVRERLVDLLGEISRRPIVKNLDGSIRKGPDDVVFWRDLPYWSYSFAEYGLHYGDPADFAADESDEYYAQAPLLLNATRFGAAVLERGEVACRLPAEADLFLEHGIEQPYDATRKMSREWQVLLPSAATWLLIAGRTFYKLCLGDESRDTREESGPGRNKWAGRAWSTQRWALWKEQLQTLAGRNDIGEECRSLAAQAVRKMADVEAEHQG